MTRTIIVVSNRVANLGARDGAGGLAVALGDALRDAGGLWFGWDGSVAEEAVTREPTVTHFGNVATATIPLSAREYRNYYLGYSNRVLWPVFHYRLDLANHRPAFTDSYRNVNARMAGQLAKLISPEDLVWVHDYHLIPLGAELRERNMENRMAFFLHIPFPSPDILLALPDHAWLIERLFSYDVIGFQTKGDLENFRRYAREQAGGSITSDGRISAFGHTVVARAFPIGIDAQEFHRMAHSPQAEAEVQRLAQRTLNRKQIISVDRLDYSKGLPERFRAFRRLLELFPENIKNVSLNQIAPPTREEVSAYVDIRKELEGLSGNINGEFGDFDWTPVRYIHRTVQRDTLAAIFRGSKVGLVVPLRDGMNLVAKEYVAAQSEDDPGVLILSQFAGAAEDLEEALIVNPYDLVGVAEAMQCALNMPLEERKERHAALWTRVRERDAKNWRDSILAELRTCAISRAA